MALRNIRVDGDPILRKKSKKVEEVNEKIINLLEDMVETMNEADGVGLAAPQIGILRRIVVVDIGEGPIKMINPEFVEMSIEDEIDVEGCLSVPGKAGTVKRPIKVVVKYTDENNEEKILKGEDFLARVICHEIDHLNGVLYTDKVEEFLQVEGED